MDELPKSAQDILASIGIKDAISKTGLPAFFCVPEIDGGFDCSSRLDAEASLKSLDRSISGLLKPTPSAANSWQKSLNRHDLATWPVRNVALASLQSARDRIKLELDNWPKKQGPAPKLAEKAVALKMAEIWYLSRGKKPEVGVADDGAATSDFGWAVGRMFQALGYEAHWRAPADFARDNLDTEKLDRMVENAKRIPLLSCAEAPKDPK